MKTITTDPFLPDTDRDHFQGLSSATINLLEYGDFECPACGEAYELVKDVQRQLGDQLCFAFREFPLPQHPHAKMAAEAAEAAAKQNRFWEMHDALFEHQNELSDETIRRLAKKLGLDDTRFAEELEHHRYSHRVEEDVEFGRRAEVDGTPAFYLNGERYEGELSAGAMLAALNPGR